MNSGKDLLNSLYTVYAEWTQRFSLVCQRGCSACCTQSVTMTSLEGEIILDFIKESGRENQLMFRIAERIPESCCFSMTTNEFAAACLNQQEIADHTNDDWDYTPCVFLEEKVCLIYQVRPFSCRSFGSLVRCKPEKAAEIYPIHLTVNTLFNQIIEHLSSECSGYWSNMTNILYRLAAPADQAKTRNLLRARPIPGLLLEPKEKPEIHGLLKKIKDQTVDQTGLGDLIDNLIRIL